MASRTLRSNSKTRSLPSKSYSVTLRNSRNKEPLVDFKSKEKIVKNKIKNAVAEIKEVTLETPKESIKEDTEKKTEEANVVKLNDEMPVKLNDEMPVKLNDEMPVKLNDEMPVKRKRGRPKRNSIVHDNNKIEVHKESKKPKIEREASPKVVTLTVEAPNSPPQKRKPRMASLNALAKVNAVLENYRFEKTSKETISDVVKKEDIEKKSKTIEMKQQEIVDLPTTEKTILPYIENSTCLDEEVEEVFLSPPPEMFDQSIQTEVGQHSKAMQTERFIFPTADNSSQTICTCCRKVEFKNHSKYQAMPYLTGVPIHVRSTSLVRTPSHTLALPIVKTHSYSESPPCNVYSGLTDNISTLLGHCINRNFSHQSSYPVCSKLMQVSAQKQALEKKKKLAEMAQQRLEQKKSAQKLVIPSLNCEPISISIPNSKYQKENTYKKQPYKKQIKQRPVSRNTTPIVKQEVCNGWVFDGDSHEESHSIGRESVTRRYYPSLCRNNDMIHVYDAVVLKSGLEGSDADYVARICSFWEDDKGPFAGEMMMSVQWYYKAEQTISKGSYDVIKGEEMEVFASRHRDDNSVACIINRCYVVTISQFARFKAQKQLVEEKRRRKISMVPEGNNHCSRLLPSPHFDPYRVFFCRYGYDYRSGKLIKNH